MKVKTHKNNEGEIETIVDKCSVAFNKIRDHWRELFIYFWVFSAIGHYIEVIAATLSLTENWYPKMPTISPIAPPYGFGVVAALLIVLPLKKKYNLNLAVVFILNTVIMMLVEFICGFIVTLMFGYNPFWDYSHQRGNIMGFTSIRNGAMFGVCATAFVYVFYPLFEKFLRSLGQKNINLIFWILAITYSLDILYITATGNWLK